MKKILLALAMTLTVGSAMAKSDYSVGFDTNKNQNPISFQKKPTNTDSDLLKKIKNTYSVKSSDSCYDNWPIFYCDCMLRGECTEWEER